MKDKEINKQMEQEQYKRKISCDKCGSLNITTSLPKRRRVCRRCGNIMPLKDGAKGN